MGSYDSPLKLGTEVHTSHGELNREFTPTVVRQGAKLLNGSGTYSWDFSGGAREFYGAPQKEGGR